MLLNITNDKKNITTINIKKTPLKIKEKTEKTHREIQISSLRELREKTLKHATKEGIFNAAKTGTVTNYITPFAIHLGFSPLIIILLSSVPQLLGSIFQLFVEKLTKITRNRQTLLIRISELEANTWILIILIAAFSINNPILLIFLITLDAIFINIQNPIWNSILRDVIPLNGVAKYFGRRNIFVSISGLISTILAGIILSKLTNINLSIGFATIFFLSFIFSKLSAYHKKRIYDPEPRPIKTEKYTFFEFVKTLKKNNFGKYVTFSSLYKLAVAISGPFFAIYMLQELNMTYIIFTTIITGSVLSSMLFTNLWTKITFREGSKKVLKYTSFLIPIIPLLWLISTDWKILLLIEIGSGALWAGFNIATSTFVFEAVNPKQKIKFMAYNNVLAGIGTFIGTMIGLAINYSNIKLLGSIFFTIFAISGILRFIVAISFINKIQEEKLVSINLKEKTYKRFITIRPKEGVVFEIIGKVKKRESKEKENKKGENKKIMNVPGKGPFKKLKK